MTIDRKLSFSAGVITPSLYGRPDLIKFNTGLKTARNCCVMRHGGITNRPGTTFVGECLDHSSSSYFIEFIYNTEQTYLIEFGDEKLRIIQDGEILVSDTVTITDITDDSDCVFTYSGSDVLSSGDYVTIESVSGSLGNYLNGRTFKVNTVSTSLNTFTVYDLHGDQLNTSSYPAYTSGGYAKKHYILSTPYAQADISGLNYVQSADVVTIVHPSYAPRELSRNSATDWEFSVITFGPSISAPTSLTISNYGGQGSSGTACYWKVTAYDADTKEESLPSSSVGSTHSPTTSYVKTLSWTAPSGNVGGYNIYFDPTGNGIFGYIGSATSTTYKDDGSVSADLTDTPPTAKNPFDGADDYPSTVTYIQQRLTFGNTNNNPETIYMSRTGFYHNFTTSNPSQDDDSVEFDIASNRVNEVMHVVDASYPVVLTGAGEHIVQGDSSGVITPTSINTKQNSYTGSSSIRPIVINNTLLYVQARGTIIRDFAYTFDSSGYTGNDLTLFSSHLFDGYTILSWAYQQIPDSLVWVVRSDGKLLCLTYVKEQAVLGWTICDMGDDLVETVNCIPSTTQDNVYVQVKRTINGNTVRYIEKLNPRFFTDEKEFIFMDSSLSYDGRNTDDTLTMTISGGTNYTYDEKLTLTASASYFSSSSVGKAIHVTINDTLYRLRVVEYTSETQVKVRANKTILSSDRNTPSSDFALAIKSLAGLWHLEGKDVSILGDSFVLASPYNSQYTVYTVTNGQITLSDFASVVHVGLPYITDIQTLSVDSVQTPGIVAGNKLTRAIYLILESTRGVFGGISFPKTNSLDGLYELKIRNEENYDDPVSLKTGLVSIFVDGKWGDSSSCVIRQTEPLPLTLLNVLTDGLYSGR